MVKKENWMGNIRATFEPEKDTIVSYLKMRDGSNSLIIEKEQPNGIVFLRYFEQMHLYRSRIRSKPPHSLNTTYIVYFSIISFLILL